MGDFYEIYSYESWLRLRFPLETGFKTFEGFFFFLIIFYFVCMYVCVWCVCVSTNICTKVQGLSEARGI